MKGSYLATDSEDELGRQESSKGTNNALLHFTTPSYLHIQKIGPEAHNLVEFFPHDKQVSFQFGLFFAHLSARILKELDWESQDLDLRPRVANLGKALTSLTSDFSFVIEENVPALES